MIVSFNPKQPFYIINSIDLFSKDLQVLIKLYQPLIGATETALYMTLIEDFDTNSALSDSKGLYFLKDQLGCEMQEFFDALHKLEGVGLVQTKLLNNPVLKQVLAFELLHVPAASEFFTTSLLTSLLKEKVGANTFKQLSNEFAQKDNTKRNKLNGYKTAKDVSASFWEVFSLPSDEAIEPSQEVQAATQENSTAPIANAKINAQDQIDWDVIKHQLEIYKIPATEVDKNKAKIREVMQTYGLSEEEFVDEVTPALHGSYQLNMKEITRILAESYRVQSAHYAYRTDTSVNSEIKIDPELKLSNQEKAAYKLAKTLAPIEFLNKLKRMQGSFVNSSENRAVYDICTRSNLPKEVINIVIYECLQESNFVPNALIGRLASDWQSKGIRTAEQAFKRIHNYHKEKKTKKTYYAGSKKRIVKGTDWSKKKAPVDDSTSIEELNNSFKNF